MLSLFIYLLNAYWQVKTLLIKQITGTVTAGTKSGTEPQLHCVLNDQFSIDND